MLADEDPKCSLHELQAMITARLSTGQNGLCRGGARQLL